MEPCCAIARHRAPPNPRFSYHAPGCKISDTWKNVAQVGEPPEIAMCRNIKTLFNFDPPATDEEINAASLQFVRKLSGFNKPSLANAAAFAQAVKDVATVARTLIDSLATPAPPRDRRVEAEKARARTRQRFHQR
jgi:hypothetical protein